MHAGRLPATNNEFSFIISMPRHIPACIAMMSPYTIAIMPAFILTIRMFTMLGGGRIRLIVGFQPLLIRSPTASWIRWCMQVTVHVYM